MTSRVGKKIAKRCGWSVQNQQAILLAFGEARSSCEFHNCSLTAGLSASSPCESNHGDDLYSAAASAGFAPGKKAANSPITSLMRLKSGSDETA